MSEASTTPASFIAALPPDKRVIMKKLRSCILSHLPKGFAEAMQSGMICYVVPHSERLAKVTRNSPRPQPLIMLASGKNGCTFHHMGLYGIPKLRDWFTFEYAKATSRKPDMGKGCVRFKNPDEIPYPLIADLVSKITPEEWKNLYIRHTAG
jgi:hypothetical protein